MPSALHAIVFILMIPPPPRSTLFPYTTLFRSHCIQRGAARRVPRNRPVRRRAGSLGVVDLETGPVPGDRLAHGDRKSTRLNSSHVEISYAVFCLKKKKNSLWPINATASLRDCL